MDYKISLKSIDRYTKVVTLSKGSKILEEVTTQGDLVTIIKNLLQSHQLSVLDIKEFYPEFVTESLTGLRIEATIANTLNWALGIKTIKDLDYPKYKSEPKITPPKKFKL